LVKHHREGKPGKGEGKTLQRGKESVGGGGIGSWTFAIGKKWAFKYILSGNQVPQPSVSQRVKYVPQWMYEGGKRGKKIAGGVGQGQGGMLCLVKVAPYRQKKKTKSPVGTKG